MATEYTRRELDRIARQEAHDIRKQTGMRAKVKDWRLLVGSNDPALLVVVETADLHQRYISMAI